jgi:hypothetical protein
MSALSPAARGVPPVVSTPARLYELTRLLLAKELEELDAAARRKLPEFEPIATVLYKLNRCVFSDVNTLSAYTGTIFSHIASLVAPRMPVAIAICVFEHESKSVPASTVDIVEPDQLQILLSVELPAARRISIFLRRIDIFDRLSPTALR